MQQPDRGLPLAEDPFSTLRQSFLGWNRSDRRWARDGTQSGAAPVGPRL